MPPQSYDIEGYVNMCKRIEHVLQLVFNDSNACILHLKFNFNSFGHMNLKRIFFRLLSLRVIFYDPNPKSTSYTSSDILVSFNFEVGT